MDFYKFYNLLIIINAVSCLLVTQILKTLLLGLGEAKWVYHCIPWCSQEIKPSTEHWPMWMCGQCAEQTVGDLLLRPRLEHGPIHLFNMLEYIDNVQLTSKERKVVYKKLQGNSYYGHPESILLARLGTLPPCWKACPALKLSVLLQNHSNH